MIFFVWLMVNSEKLMSRGLARSCQQIESDGVLTLETSAFCNSLREFTNFISLLLITSLLFYLPVHVAQQWYINNLVPFSFGVFLIDTVSLPVCLFVSLRPRRNNKANFAPVSSLNKKILRKFSVEVLFKEIGNFSHDLPLYSRIHKVGFEPGDLTNAILSGIKQICEFKGQDKVEFSPTPYPCLPNRSADL